MSLSSRDIYTKNKDLQRLLDQLARDCYGETPTQVAKEFGRCRIVRDNRKNIRIAQDLKMHISIVKIKDPLKVKKIGDFTYSFF